MTTPSSEIASPVPLPAGSSEIHLPGFGWLVYEEGDAVLQGLRCGDFEFLERAWFVRTLRPGDCFVDCGAHCGLFSVLAARQIGPNGSVHAIEPTPATYRYLVGNLDALGLGNAQSHHLALGETEGDVGLAIGEPGCSAYNHVVATSSPDGVTVRQLTLPRFAEIAGLGTIDFLKIDTEGHEMAIINGAVPMLAEGRVRTLMVEFTAENFAREGYQGIELADRLIGLGYSFWRLDPTSADLVAVEGDFADSYTNYFATLDPEKLRARFAEAKTPARRLAADILAKGRAVASLLGQKLTTIREQHDYIKILESEQDRLKAQANLLQAEAPGVVSAKAQTYIDQLLAQVRSQTEGMQQQDALIAKLRAEVERLETEPKDIISPATQEHIDRQLRKIAEQTETIAELGRFVASLQQQLDQERTIRTEVAHQISPEAQAHIDDLRTQMGALATTCEEQRDYITSLEEKCASADQSIRAQAAEIAVTFENGQKHIDDLKAQLDTLAQVSIEQTNYIKTLEQDLRKMGGTSGAGQKPREQ